MSEESPADVARPDLVDKFISESIIQEALQKDKGPDAQLQGFAVRDFCPKGANYATYVTSVDVSYDVSGEVEHVSYIAKVNQFSEGAGVASFVVFSALAFRKEGKFYMELLPALNEWREKVDMPLLRSPGCFYASSEEGQELILLEDMRKKSYQMVDYKAGLNNDQILLVVKELANLHATSVVLRDQMGTDDFLATFDFFDEVFTYEGISDMFRGTLSSYIDNGVHAATKLGGHDELVERLAEMAPNCYDLLAQTLSECDEEFRVVNHGDCWTNNLLFRYGEDGEVADVCLLDLQVLRHASLSLDLNFLLFTSLDSSTRRGGLTAYLTAYYDAYKAVLDTANMPMRFTLDQLYEEYRRKNIYGMIMFFMSLTAVGLEYEDIPAFTELTEENMTENIDKIHIKLLAAIDSDENLRSRLVGLLEEVEENNIY